MKFFILLLFFVFISGCAILPIPHKRNVTPVFYGIVIDHESGQPIENVEITVKSDGENPDEAKTYTDKEGKYRLVAKQNAKWYFIVLIGPFEGFCIGKISYSHPEYEKVYFEVKNFNGANFDGTCTGPPIHIDMSLNKIHR